MSLQHPSSACYFLDPTTRRKELRLHLEELVNEFNYFKMSDEEAQHEATKLDQSYNLEDEAKRLFNEVQSAMGVVKESVFYCKLVNQLDSSVFQEQLKILLGSHPTLKMVIYALGSMEFSYRSIFQLVIPLLMKERYIWIEEIDVYDPGFLRADIIVLKKAECNVLLENENTRRKVDKPTLFFIPYGGDHLLGNVFEANWCPSQINQLLILCPSINDKQMPHGLDDVYVEVMKKHSMEISLPNYSFEDESVQVMRKHSIEIPLPNYGNDVLDGFAWHFFKMDSHLDMDTLISGKVRRWETIAERMENRRLSKEERLLRRREYDEKINGASFTYVHRFVENMFLEPYDENTNDEDECWDSENTNAEEEGCGDENINDEKEGSGDENTNDGEEGWGSENTNDEKEGNGDEKMNDEKKGWSNGNTNDGEEGWSDNNKNDSKENRRCFIRYLVQHRAPRMYRCSWHAPPKGWMKLNIASSSRKGREELEENLMTGYGGICHNENKEGVLIYKGKIEKVDQFTACVEALKIGLEGILKKFRQSKPKLIVESDNFKLVHWANWDHRQFGSSPAFQVEEFGRIHDLLNQYDSYIIYQIYEEANEKAISFAKQETT